FNALSGFDAFSFGPGEGLTDLEPVGLRIAGLAIDMSFDLTTPTYKDFSFNLTAVTTDESRSQPPPGSLFQNFPLRVVDIETGSAADRPDKSNFLPLDAPFDSAELSDQWFALRHDLNLGSPGNLAAQVNFTAQVILAWSPSGSGGGIFF